MEQFEQELQYACALHSKGDLKSAVQIYDRLLAKNRRHPHLLYAYGTAMTMSDMHGLGVELLSNAVKHNPKNHEAWHNLGMAYRTLGIIDQAVAAYTQVLTLDIDDDAKAKLYGNLSGCFINEACPEKCLEFADKGLALAPNSPQLHNHKALALLELGRYEEGFNEWEARFNLPEFVKRDYGNVPRWDGKPTKSLVIHGEQGLGDEIMFMTCLKKVIPLAEEIHVECAFRLLGLFQHSFRAYPQIKFYATHSELVSKVSGLTAWTAMGSLPHDTWPWEKWTYLQSSRKYRKGNWPRVGISWRGGTLKTHEYHRNAPLGDWKQLVWACRSMGIECISVQYGPAEQMAKELDVEHDHASIADMDTLTGMVQSCDLVISVCNTTVHQAGATNTPCWQLTPSKPDWRWGLEGESCYWYDSVSFIRQDKGESWNSVLARTVERLKVWAEDKQTLVE